MTIFIILLSLLFIIPVWYACYAWMIDEMFETMGKSAINIAYMGLFFLVAIPVCIVVFMYGITRKILEGVTR